MQHGAAISATAELFFYKTVIAQLHLNGGNNNNRHSASVSKAISRRLQPTPAALASAEWNKLNEWPLTSELSAAAGQRGVCQW